MSSNSRPSQWSKLLGEAYRIIDHHKAAGNYLDNWTLGGGTAMMLQIAHRESHDVDLFIDDPQMLPYLTASAKEIGYRIGEPSFSGDGVRHFKIAFDKVGEIDFIVAKQVSELSSLKQNILGRDIQLETIPEVVAKKLFYRGAHIEPRDIFDIAAACASGFERDIVAILSVIPEHREKTVERLEKLNPQYVDTIIGQLMLKPGFETVAQNAFEKVKILMREMS